MGEGRVGDGGGAGGTAGMSARAFVCIAAVRMVMFCWGVWRDFLFFCAASRVPACSCDQDVLFCVGSARLDAIFRE